jgi:hypothetical protein
MRQALEREKMLSSKWENLVSSAVMLSCFARFGTFDCFQSLFSGGNLFYITEPVEIRDESVRLEAKGRSV